MSETAYHRLETRMRRIGEAAAVLHWDWSAIMPVGGADARSEQLAELKAISHGLLTDAETGELIEAAGEDDSLDDWQRANLELIRHDWIKASAVPEDLVVAAAKACSECETVWRTARAAKACSECETVWRTARADKNFAQVLPSLQTAFDLVMEAGRAKAERLGLSLHDALLDDYEPGLRLATIDPVFDDLAGWIPDFLDDVLSHQSAGPEPVALEGPFPTAIQKALGEKLMAAVGFDFEGGRLDESLHPFCGGTPDDVRITTRYDEGDFTSALMGVLHETGHALYEAGLPKDWRRQPVGHSLGMSIHESQSLLIEMQVCRSRDFFEYAAPIMRDAFGGSSEAWAPENLYMLGTRVERGFIRVEADEVTYPAHVILRHRLEKALVTGDLKLADLPAAFDEAMEDILAIRPPDAALGVLQDIHWYAGVFGYFPTYTLGALTAAQFFQTATQADNGIVPGIRSGNFQPLIGWLRENIHGKGSRVSADELVEEVTGKALDPAVFKGHLRVRYLGGAG